MTGKEQRVLSSYHAISAQKMQNPEIDHSPAANADEVKVKEVVYDLPELRHNIDLILDQCEEELIRTDRSLNFHKNRIGKVRQQLVQY